MSYVRRRPDQTVLYRVVREHAERLFEQARERSASGYGYPAHVENEFRRYLECGILSHGFVRVHCAGCGRDEVVAFSCKGRAVCPSCVGRRMADTAARLVDERLPEAGYRQWVFSFPYRLRVALASDGALWSEVLRACVRKVFAFQRKRARARGVKKGKSLGLCFAQRFGSLLQLNPHGHAVVPDAVWSDDGGGALAACALEAPTEPELQAVALQIVKAVLRVVRRAAERADDEDDDAAAMWTTLAEAAAATAGPRARSSEGRRTRLAAQIQTELGVFSIHAGTSVRAGDRAGLERLLRYGARPALAHRRLSVTASGKVCYRLRKPYYTGQTEVVLEPVAFLRRLAALVPPARQHQVRYYGLLSSQARDRERLAELVPGAASDDDDAAGDERDADDVTHRGRASPAYRVRWAKLLARVFRHQVLCCPHCGARRAIVAAITDRDVATAILSHLGLPTDAPELAPARAPPQTEMFGDERAGA